MKQFISKYYGYILLSCLIFYIGFINLEPNTTSVEKDLNHSFKGYLKSISYYHITRYRFEVGNNKTEEFTGLSHPLVEKIEIGDTLVKYKSDNSCTLIKQNGAKYNLPFIFISKKERTSIFIPSKWKNKPIEWYGE